ncbi:MAG: hypothetical protein NTY50_18400 [Methylobacter sp.]|nr:hypothetical protein [Methylobacter sp.]
MAFTAIPQVLPAHAKTEMRSIPQQLSYRAEIGRAALGSPDLPIEFVRDTLIAMEDESKPFE